jgi:hypothetical protein
VLTPACPLLTPKNWSTSCGRPRADGGYGPAAVSPAAISTYGPISDAAAQQGNPCRDSRLSVGNARANIGVGNGRESNGRHTRPG